MALVGSFGSAFNAGGRVFWGVLADKFSFRVSILVSLPKSVWLRSKDVYLTLWGMYLIISKARSLYLFGNKIQILAFTLCCNCYGKCSLFLSETTVLVQMQYWWFIYIYSFGKWEFTFICIICQCYEPWH